MTDLDRVEVMDGQREIRTGLDKLSQFAWGDGKPIIGKKLDKLADKVMFSENLLKSRQNGIS